MHGERRKELSQHRILRLRWRQGPQHRCLFRRGLSGWRIRAAGEIDMSLTLYFHPLSSFCWKVLAALYENDTPFTPNQLTPGDEAERSALLKLWPIGKFPVLEDKARNEVVAESSIIIEYLGSHYPGRTRFIPQEPDRALLTRL